MCMSGQMNLMQIRGQKANEAERVSGVILSGFSREGSPVHDRALCHCTRDASVEALSMTPADETWRAYRRNSSRRRLVWARLTGISVCFLSSMRSW